MKISNYLGKKKQKCAGSSALELLLTSRVHYYYTTGQTNTSLRSVYSPLSSHLHETVLMSVFSRQPILGQHLLDNLCRIIAHRQQQRLVGYIPTQGLAIDLQRAAGVGAAVFGSELLQLLLEFLLPTATHHGLRVGN